MHKHIFILFHLPQNQLLVLFNTMKYKMLFDLTKLSQQFIKTIYITTGG